MPIHRDERKCRVETSDASLNQTPTGIECVPLRLEIAGHESARHLSPNLWLFTRQRVTNGLFDVRLGAGHMPTAGNELPAAAPPHSEGRSKDGAGTDEKGSEHKLSAHSAWDAYSAPRQRTPNTRDHRGAHRALKHPARVQVLRVHAKDDIPF